MFRTYFILAILVLGVSTEALAWKPRIFMDSPLAISLEKNDTTELFIDIVFSESGYIFHPHVVRSTPNETLVSDEAPKVCVLNQESVSRASRSFLLDVELPHEATDYLKLPRGVLTRVSGRIDYDLTTKRKTIAYVVQFSIDKKVIREIQRTNQLVPPIFNSPEIANPNMKCRQ